MKRWIAVAAVIAVIVAVVVVCSAVAGSAPAPTEPAERVNVEPDKETEATFEVSFKEGDDVGITKKSYSWEGDKYWEDPEFSIDFERIADKETAVNVSKVLADSYGKQLGLKKLELSFTEYDADDKVWTVTFAEESGGGVLNIALDQVDGGVVKVWQDDDAVVTDAVAITDYETVLKLTQVYVDRYFDMENDDEDYAPRSAGHNTKYDVWTVDCVPKYMFAGEWAGGDIYFAYNAHDASVINIIPGE